MNTNRQTAVIKGNNKESKMKITASNLIRWAGLSAMVAGILFVVIQTIHPPDILSSVTTSRWAIVHYLSHRHVPPRPARHYGDLRQASGRGRLAWSGRLSPV